MKTKTTYLAVEPVERPILIVRGQKVILDADLSRIYGVSTKALNQAVKRNAQRFPSDFVFQLTETEKAEVVTICDHLQKLKFSPVLPYAFTEHGAIMAANVLNSDRAVQMSVFVVRAFVKMREVLAHNKALADKLAELERKLTSRLDVHERAIVLVLRELRELMNPPAHPEPPRKQIGFGVRERGAKYRVRRLPRMDTNQT
jgi:phage regulator Rha-like protein